MNISFRFCLTIILLILFKSNISFSNEEYKSFKKMPCKFNGVTVGSSAYPRIDHDNSYKKLVNRCSGKSKKPIFYEKEGTSLNTKYNTPIVAVADMYFHYAKDYGAKYRCSIKKGVKGYTSKSAGKMNIKVPDPDDPSKIRKCQTPYDGIEIVFKLPDKNEFIKYYHLTKTPVVPGFGVGNCKIPLMKDRTDFHTRYPEDCGGPKIFEVKKGDIIGYSGSAGKDHFGIGFFKNGKWLIAPEDHTNWENFPSENKNIFLLPIINSGKIRNYSEKKTQYYDEVRDIKNKITNNISISRDLRKCIVENKYSGDVQILPKNDDNRVLSDERLKISKTSIYSALTSICFFKVKNNQFNFNKIKKVDESCFKKGKFGNIINTC